MASQTDCGVPLSTLSPKFLNSNSTSHTWPFSAIAELIDNAYDPDVRAKQLWIDVIEINGEKCLSFMDNGNGLNYETMHKMLSFGYSEKKTVSGQKPIGVYGNGFKSGSMRLGKDAIVFSKSRSMMCVGMLSQTYLEKIRANQIRVPIVCFEKRKSDKFYVRDEHKSSLQDILRYSLFKTKEELLIEIGAINSFGSSEATGTRIIIWNLCRTSTGATEFDFETDCSDIQIPLELFEAQNDSPQHANRNTSSIPDSVYSLKAYCQILYLKPRMQIMVRGQRVMSVLMAKSLACIRKDHYKPTFLDKRIPITFGYSTKNKEQYGIMLYHKNRLIKAYERVGCQLKPNTKGVGVIGVIECDFLEPTHNKQSFTENDKYRKTIINLGVKLEEYWNEIRYIKSKTNQNSTVPVEDTMKQPDQNWVQCDDCLKWRKLPDGINNKKLPKKWYCRINPDPQFRSCLVEEELEEVDDQMSYCKTYKQQEKEEKKKQEKKLEQVGVQVQVHEAQQPSAIVKEFEVLNQQHENIMQRLHQKPSPTAQTSRSQQGRTLRVKFTHPSLSSQAACSPSTTSGLPVITNVSSLATDSQKGKRTQLITSPSTPKRAKIKDFQQSTSPTPSAEVESSTYANNNDRDKTDVDKLNPVTTLLKRSKKTAVDVTLGEAAAGMSTAVKTNCPPVVNSSTQTFVKPESNQGEQILPNGVAHMESDETPGPSTLPQFPRIIEILQQQDQLLELMQDTAQERDTLKQEVQILTIQLQEQSHVRVKKECTHQGCQTEEDYRGLFAKAKQKINDLIKDKEAFIVAAGASIRLNTDRDEERDIDEISLQFGCLVNKLDQTEKQRDELRSQLDSLEEERSKLAARCEELRLSLQQQRENAQASKRDSAQSGSEEAGVSTNSGSNTEIYKSLLELRQNVGRLLISYVPALDLEQVNYQCNVIDEILEQVLNGVQMYRQRKPL